MTPRTRASNKAETWVEELLDGAGEVVRNQGIWILFFQKLWRVYTQRSGLIRLELWISDDRVARG